MKKRVHRYLLLFKPYGVVCDFYDEAASTAHGQGEGRPTLAGYLLPPGVQPAGRLDLDSEGLVLLTDDGEVLHRLSHPRYHQLKTYLVQVQGVPDQGALTALRSGVAVKGRRTAPAEVELLAGEPALPPRTVPVVRQEGVPAAWLRVVLTEGRKRQIRHMTAAVGHPTLRLVRIGIGSLSVGELLPGEWRDLTALELRVLRAELGLGPAAPG
jgi:23S rRNA pseudouridine2457 synthase